MLLPCLSVNVYSSSSAGDNKLKILGCTRRWSYGAFTVQSSENHHLPVTRFHCLSSPYWFFGSTYQILRCGILSSYPTPSNTHRRTLHGISVPILFALFAFLSQTVTRPSSLRPLLFFQPNTNSLPSVCSTVPSHCDAEPKGLQQPDH